jgi:2-desacetyl-2-hydroxyethyl bacteriochlorophyllide A dehydrogenase
MTATMKAALLRSTGHLVVEELPIPVPDEGWVRVRTQATGICGSDLHMYTGNHPWMAPDSPMLATALNKVYGHEVAGIVDAVGPGVSAVAVGDRVALEGIVPCLNCEYCRVGQFQICSNLNHLGVHYPGGFAEYLLLPSRYVHRLPDNVTFEEGALLDVLVVGVHAVHVAKVSMADRVAVIGAGPIGIAIACAAKRAGARRVFVVAKHPIQQELVQSVGGLDVVDAAGDPAARVLEETGALGVDCVIEGIGYKASSMNIALAMLRKGGRIVFTGVFEEPVALNFGELLIKEATISASHAFGMWDLVPELDIAMDMLSRREFPAGQLITHRFPIDQINEAFRAKLEHPDTTVKAAIVF